MNSYFWFTFLPLHVLFASFAMGANLWLVVLFWVLLSGYGVGVTLHRLLSHRAFSTTPLFTKILSVIACLCAQGSPLFWVNVHRGYHHRYSDTAKDIHSPIHGKLWAYFLWAIRHDLRSLNYRNVPDLLRDDFQLKLSKYYFEIVIASWFFAYLISPAVLASLLVAQVLTMHLEFFVNCFLHTKGIPFFYRNFDTTDNSQNFWIMGVLNWGIGFHNNHHANPKSVSFASKKWEFDPTVLLIKLLPKTGSSFK
jgi:fatty-acid desaturase